MPFLYVVNSAVTILTMVASLGCIVGHLKNYRKPMDQRLVVRLLLLVPLFSLTAWANLFSPRLSRVLEPLKELYEAFVIYTFFSLLTSILGGEREIIFSTTGRPPVKLVWPFNKITPSVDISDPVTFVIIKRCIMQYVWIRPLLTVLGVLFGDHVWLFSTIIYNVSMTIALNALSMFWYCLYADLKPYNVMLKFLSIKLVVFFSYWQTLALGILHAIHLIDSSETLFRLQNTLLSFEMLGFAVLHWIAFPYTDYATTALIGFGRLPIYYAIRDVLGTRDLVYDFQTTFLGSKYGYENFDSIEAVLDHPESRTRQARLAAGLRYKNQGRSKYWLPARTVSNQTRQGYDSISSDASFGSAGSDEYIRAESPSPSSVSDETPVQFNPIRWDKDDVEGDERIYRQARLLFGDYNYPVITVRESVPYITIQERERRALRTPLLD